MTRLYTSGGARLAFDDTGTGLPVIFLHPTPLDGDFWRPLVADLPGVRSIVPDLRGHGSSELGPDLPVGEFARVPDAPAITMARYAADVLALLDHLSLPNAIFAGCSIGGYILLELWRQAPQCVRGLAFICSKPQADAEANLVKRVATIAQARAGETAALFDGMAQSLVGVTARQRRPEIVSELRSRMTVTPDALVAVQAGLAVRPDSVRTVSGMAVPVLAVAGGEDAVVAPAEMESFRSAPGGCEFHLLPDAGHFAAYEQSDKVAARMAPWLRSFRNKLADRSSRGMF